MKICVIGGANVDISATSAGPFVAGDSNPGTVRIAPGGVGRNIAHNLALLGDEVSLVTVFGDDHLGRLLRESCLAAGLDLSLSQVAAGARNACFVSVNGSDGELLGGVADMAVTGLMTPDWLEERLDRINGADVVVADTNLPADTLALLVGGCLPPLYIDSVSSAKAVRLRAALLSSRLPGAGPVFVKCNRLEAEVLGLRPARTASVPGDGGLAPLSSDVAPEYGADGQEAAPADGFALPASVARVYVSLGSEGLRVVEGGSVESFPALPVTGIVNATGAGDALLAGIVHAGADATAAQAASLGQRCARLAMLSADAVSDAVRTLA